MDIMALFFFIQVAEAENWRNTSVFSLERTHIGIYKSVISDLVSILSLAKLSGVD